MAANKFATMLHLHTHRTAAILIYTLLEWTLIALLLLNASLSYLISKFASFFGLHPPCLFCNRVDHLFEPARSHRDMLCDDHAAEISRLGFCFHHRKLAEATDMCEDCSPEPADRTVALLSWMKRSEAGEKDIRCSCCGVALESGFYSPYLVIKQDWSGALGVIKKGNSVVDEDLMEVKDEEGAEREDLGLLSYASVSVEDSSIEALAVCSKGLDDVADGRLVPVDLIDSATLMEKPVEFRHVGDEDGEIELNLAEQMSALISFDEIEDRSYSRILERIDSFENSSMEQMAALVLNGGAEDISSSNVLEMHDIVVDHPLVPRAEESAMDCSGAYQCVLLEATPEHSIDVNVQAVSIAEDSGALQASEDNSRTTDCEANCEISIGSEICDQENFDQSHFLEPVYEPVAVEAPFVEEYGGTTDREQQVIESGPTEPLLRDINRLSIYPELNEVEEDRSPETPTSLDGFHAIHKRFFFERRESGTESFDGSVASEIEGGETLTVDHLKSALKAERKALSALYVELEEERSASAIAANQTMAMITRLHEEKAAMQMEALQYQRMMEEQSEYDQEALQLLNELMVKREREKQELEKEMDVYRRKVLLYEAKARSAGGKASHRSGTSSPSTAEDSDGHSFDFHEGDDCFNIIDESNQNTPTDSILSSGVVQETAKHLIPLDESLDDFEEERLSILEQLKALEEKLFTLDDLESSSNLEAVEIIEENGHVLNGDYGSLSKYESIVVDGFSDDLDANGKLHSEQRSMIGYRGKRLLPLFDAVNLENDDSLPPEQNETDASPKSVSKFNVEHKKLAIAEEVNSFYERLQALEADREFLKHFLKHCVSSLKKGNKGMDLFQEILQHLRDLRNVEFRARNVGDALA